MAGAYYEKIARINLTTGEIRAERLDPTLARGFIGGRGLGAKILLDEGVAAAHPLSPENKLLCVTGPMTGAVAPSSGRYTLVTKSPVTGKIASSNSGGIWGAKLKYAGWDAVIIEGEAKEWTYISIEDAAIRLHDAREYIGTMTTELDGMLKTRHGADASVLSIGPAGEKRVLLAAIMNDRIRAAGRGGIGAVMGSKKLKAIVVRTSRTHLDTIADLDALKASTGHALNIIKEKGASGIGLRTLNSSIMANIVDSVGQLPARSWHLSGSEQDEKQLAKPGGCYRCPIACSRAGKTEPESRCFDSTNQTGGDMNIFDKCSILCNEYGLDTIGVHRTVAAAAELYQRGAIKENGGAGVPLEWYALVEWTKRIGNPETEFDRLMSSGADHLCEHYGIPEISRKGRKMSARKEDSAEMTDPSQQPNLTAAGENDANDKAFHALPAVIDSMGQCLFASSVLGLREYTDLLNAAIGTNWTIVQMLEIGDRIRSIEHMFNKAACACHHKLVVGPERKKEIAEKLVLAVSSVLSSRHSGSALN